MWLRALRDRLEDSPTASRCAMLLGYPLFVPAVLLVALGDGALVVRALGFLVGLIGSAVAAWGGATSGRFVSSSGRPASVSAWMTRG